MLTSILRRSGVPMSQLDLGSEDVSSIFCSPDTGLVVLGLVNCSLSMFGGQSNNVRFLTCGNEILFLLFIVIKSAFCIHRLKYSNFTGRFSALDLHFILKNLNDILFIWYGVQSNLLRYYCIEILSMRGEGGKGGGKCVKKGRFHIPSLHVVQEFHNTPCHCIPCTPCTPCT